MKKGLHIIRAMFPEVDVKTPMYLSFPIDIAPPSLIGERLYEVGWQNRYGYFAPDMPPAYSVKVYW